MQKVDIYIDALHKGHLKKGTGTYAIILEYMTSHNYPITRDYIGGISKTTKNRVALAALIEALSHLKRPCELSIVINSQYVVQAINSGTWLTWLETGHNAKGQPAKNLDLWQQVYELMEGHQVEITYKEQNSYSYCMRKEIEKRSTEKRIEYKEDTGNV